MLVVFWGEGEFFEAVERDEAEGVANSAASVTRLCPFAKNCYLHHEILLKCLQDIRGSRIVNFESNTGVSSIEFKSIHGLATSISTMETQIDISHLHYAQPSPNTHTAQFNIPSQQVAIYSSLAPPRPAFSAASIDFLS
jgi:hypothetical protein